MKTVYFQLPLFISLLLFSTAGSGQLNEPLGQVGYIQMTASKADTGKAEKQYNQKDMVLFFGKSASLFQQVSGKSPMRIRTADGKEADSAMTKLALAELEKRMPGFENRPRAGSQIYRSYANSIFHIQQIYNGEKYLISDEAPVINWQVTDKTKTIGTYTCRLATGTFRGRTYDAWFAPDIPVSAGPWKLCGLPGLILEAADKTGEVRFQFKNLQIPFAGSGMDLQQPAEGKKVTMAEYQAVVNKNLERLENMLKASGGNINVNRQELVLLEKE